MYNEGSQGRTWSNTTTPRQECGRTSEHESGHRSNWPYTHKLTIALAHTEGSLEKPQNATHVGNVSHATTGIPTIHKHKHPRHPLLPTRASLGALQISTHTNIGTWAQELHPTHTTLYHAHAIVQRHIHGSVCSTTHVLVHTYLIACEPGQPLANWHGTSQAQDTHALTNGQ